MDRDTTRPDRRTVLMMAVGCGLASFPAGHAFAQEAAALDAALRRLIGDKTPIEGRVTLTVPDISENGNTVPFDVEVESPMTDDDYVAAVHMFAPANPQPDVAGYFFTPASGKASVSSRMRLARSQEVYAVAVLSDGRVFMTRQAVKVTIGGCGG